MTVASHDRTGRGAAERDRRDGCGRLHGRPSRPGGRDATTRSNGSSRGTTDAATDAPGDHRVARGFAALIDTAPWAPYLVAVPDEPDREISVLIADDDAAIRDVVSEMIESTTGFTLVGAAEDAAGATRLASIYRPDVALLDIRMPGGGPAAAHEIMRSSPNTRVIALSGHDDRVSVREMIAEGAISYLTKDEPIEEIVGAIRDAAQGKTRLSDPVRSLVVSELSARLGRERRDREERADKERRIRRILAHGEGLQIAYQPIVDLPSRRTIGVEALARFALDPLRPPDAWFAEAAEVGLGVELELTALQLALGALERLPDPLFLSVNLGSAAILRPDLAGILQRHPRGRILVEITEHIPTIADANLHARLSEIRAAGARIAIDDVGAGYTSLHHILELAPDTIKLDMALTRRVDAEPRNRALIASLVAFAEQVGMSLIAEGVETAAEAWTLLELGVSAVQGFYIARPGPLADPFVDPVFPG